MILRVFIMVIVISNLFGCSDLTPSDEDSSDQKTPTSMMNWQAPTNARFSNYQSSEFKLQLEPVVSQQKIIVLKVMSSSNPEKVLYLANVPTGSKTISLNLITLKTEPFVNYEIFTDSGLTSTGTFSLLL